MASKKRVALLQNSIGDIKGGGGAQRFFFYVFSKYENENVDLFFFTDAVSKKNMHPSYWDI